MTVGVAIAMASERALVEALLENRAEETARSRRFVAGTLGPNRVVLAETGIGKVNAAVGAAALLDAFRPDCLVSTGVAGGLDPSLRVGDVVAAAEVVYHDVDCGPGNEYGQVQGMPPRFRCDGRLLALAAAAGAAGGARIVRGLLASGDTFVAERGQQDAIRARFPDALAVDMESGALAQVCHVAGVPFLSLRILSDAPDAGDGRYAQYEDFWATAAERAFAVSGRFLRSLPASLGAP